MASGGTAGSRRPLGVVGRTLALLAAGALVVAAFLPWTAAGTVALDLGVRSLGQRAGQPTVALILLLLAAGPALAALIHDAGWPRGVAGAATAVLILAWLGFGPDGALVPGVVVALAAAVGLLLSGALATGAAAESRSGSAGPDPGARRPGYRLVDHIADIALEAWGPTRADGLSAAVRALVESFADTTDAPARARHQIAFYPEPDEDLLVTLLEEVIYLLDAHGQVPVGASLRDEEDGGLSGEFQVADVADVAPAGAVPKAVTYHGLSVESTPERWSCHVTIDV